MSGIPWGGTAEKIIEGIKNVRRGPNQNRYHYVHVSSIRIETEDDPFEMNAQMRGYVEGWAWCYNVIDGVKKDDVLHMMQREHRGEPELDVRITS